jgi:glycosyltransferase involved in cell wall biosynthesis
MSNPRPRVSIGMPVYNGERFLRDALDSILSQTFENFEVIISDNASTDGTQEVCQAYMAQDRRIHYFRNETNLGASRNYNRVFELSSGEYFKWVAHDDVCAPDFLLRCVEVLDQDASVVLCYPRARHIDEHGKFMQDYDAKRNPLPDMSTDSPKPQERFHDLILVNHWCFQIFGVMRASTLRITPLIGNYAASDRILLARIGLLGRFYEIPEYLFFRRRHSGQLTAVPTHYLHLHTGWYDPAKEGRVVLPQWRMFFEYLISIGQVPLSWPERMACYLHMGRWLRKNRSRMNRDLIRATKQILRPYKGRRRQEEVLKDSLRK